MSEEDKIALFDAYLAGELPAEEARDFERSLDQDAQLRSEFEEYHSFSEEIFAGQEYAEITSKISAIHDSIHQKDKKGSRPFILRPKFMIPLGVAAAITLLVIIVNPFSFVGNGDTAS